ncbi:hypothetical protein BX600DRAFT_510040 [Xylariales sp. PMI_506]|nr:hypothetical protein BX600DRAFT_510040 [Xylariales sp. PMI_506]
MAGTQIKPSDEPSGPQRSQTGGKPKRQPSNANTLPGTHGLKQQEVRRQISNPVQRSASHANDQYSKARPINTSRRGPARNASVKEPGNPRPGITRDNNSFQSRYVEMLLNLDTIPRLHNILASFFSWILLAGYVVFPGTFTSIQDLSSNSQVQSNAAASEILDHVKNVPLLVIAAICCCIGIIGMGWLAIRWHRNYVWLLNRLFLPGIMNGFAGLISTLVTVYTQQSGDWSITAKVSAIVEGGSMGVSIILFVLFNNLLLSRVKKRHGEAVAKAQQDEGFMEKAGRKLQEPALEPGSVV